MVDDTDGLNVAVGVVCQVGGDVQGLLQTSGLAKDLAHANYCSKYDTRDF